MPTIEKPKKNLLAIRLNESAVFLRSDDTSGRNLHHDSRPSMLRGLLSLNLSKPEKITSIELELTAKVYTGWLEGAGTRRVDVTEEHKVFTATTTMFRASDVTHRRAASLGPSYNEDGLEDLDEDLQALPMRESDTITSQNSTHADTQILSPRAFSPTRGGRHMSMDPYLFSRNAATVHYQEDNLPPLPPYSPRSLTPALSHGTLTPSSSLSLLSAPSSQHLESPHFDNPALALEQSRNALRADLTDMGSTSVVDIPLRSSQIAATSSAPSTRSPSLSRRSSLEEDERYSASGCVTSTLSQRSAEPERSPSEHSGRKSGSTFRLSSMGSVLFDAMLHSPSRGREREPHWQHGVIENESNTRGRRMERLATDQTRPSTPPHLQEKNSSGISRAEDTEEGRHKRGWKEFKKGTYTYPISFAIPGHAPPTLETSSGAVTWKLKATVHRPGTFKTKLTTQQEVVVVTCPTEEDTEDTENIIVERYWDGQLQYLISVSGKSFYIGGTVPVTFTMMPLSKMKIHRITIYIEEKIEYFTQFRRVIRTEPLHRIFLLTVKDERAEPSYILPLNSDDPDALKHSPLSKLIGPDDDISEMTSNLMGPGPWKFHQELQLPKSCKVLRFTNRNRRSNVSITHTLNCVLRVERGDDDFMDEKTGKRKLFDIVVKTPIHILSCRCNPEWTSLPLYSNDLPNSVNETFRCPCESNSEPRGRSAQGKWTPPGQTRSDVSTSTNTVDPYLMGSPRTSENASMMDSNIIYEQLVSGMVTEAGEAPPPYGVTV